MEEEYFRFFDPILRRMSCCISLFVKLIWGILCALKEMQIVEYMHIKHIVRFQAFAK